MTVKVLIVDPDIAFAVPIKRALEQSGDYAVNVFANGKAAVEAVQRDPQDVAILDFHVSDMPLPTLISELRRLQPGLFILTSPRTQEEVAQLPALDAQGSITKPYFARQLGPVIREAMAARSRLARKELDRRATSEIVRPKLVEAPAKAEDSFSRIVVAMYTGDTTGKMKPIRPEDLVRESAPKPIAPAIAEPPTDDEATIRDVVSGQAVNEQTTPLAKISNTSVSASQPPATMPEPIRQLPVQDSEASPMLASIALAAAQDPGVPMEALDPPEFIARIEQELGETTDIGLPVWAQPDAGKEDPSAVAEPPIIPEDTQYSAQLQAWLSGDTQPLGGIVQESLEQFAQAAPETDPATDVEPEPPVAETHEVESSAVPVPIASSSRESINRLARALESTSSEPVEPPPVSAEPESNVPALDAPPPTAFPPAHSPTEPGAAALAVRLTQLTVDSAAEITLLTRGNILVASAGQLVAQAISGLVEAISAAWQSNGENSSALVRFINVPGIGDYLLYSTPTADQMVLSMLFPADTPLKDIRRQAKALITAMEAVPDLEPELSSASVARTEPEAAITQLSRPTDLLPPDGLHEAVAEAVDNQAGADSADAPAQPPRVEGPYAAYAFVWLPRTDLLGPELANTLHGWIDGIVKAHAWQLDGIEIQPEFITVQISVPANHTPTVTVEALMQETAARANEPALWADAYYIVAPGRAVTQQEIASFIEYHRNAQNAA